MSDYKLVPVVPTAEMVGAAEDAYMPFGDMEMAIRMAVLAAPAVQGEPVATIHVDGSFVHVAWRIPAPSRCAMDVYTAPQPAEQQPAPDVAGLIVLLEHAQCPNCDGSGARYDSHGEPEQCQWCYERNAALAAYRKQGGEK